MLVLVGAMSYEYFVCIFSAGSTAYESALITDEALKRARQGVGMLCRVVDQVRMWGVEERTRYKRVDNEWVSCRWVVDDS